MASPPTQELPPWYTEITSTGTDAAGNPTATFTTLMRLPLTYYGPSIPLGTDTNIWVYGGPTPPPSTTVSSTTSSSTTSSTPSSTLTPTSSTTTSPTSLSITSLTGPTGSSTGSTSAGPTSSPGSSRLGGTAIGAIVGSIIAALMILLCCLLALRWRRSRRRQREGHDLLTPVPERHRHSRLYSFTDDSPQRQPVEPSSPREPIWTGWSMVHASTENRSVPPVEGGWTLVHDNGSGDRVPGEGSPRGSGEETDPFLRASYSNQMSQHPSARLVPPAPVLDATQNSMDSASTGASGYGNVVEPSQARFSHLVPTTTVTQWGNILPPAVLTQMVDEPRRHDDIIEEEEEEESLLEPPPRLDPDRLGASRTTPRPSIRSLGTSRSERSLPPPETPASWDETPELMTAQRIRVDEMNRADAHEVPSPTAGSSSLLGRLGWLNRRSRHGTPERQESRPTTPHPELDVVPGPSSRLLGHPGGFRPISGHSGTSGESGSTLFHDAQSRPETPPPLPSLPPALTTRSRSRLPMSEPMQESTSEAPTIRVVGTSSPSQSQADDMDPFADTTSSTVVPDPLDAPAPTSRLPTASYEHDPTFPPSLIISRSWMSSGTLGDSDRTDSPEISMDVYEEAPPPVAERWRFIAGSNGSGRFIQPVLVHPRDVSRSEVGSLHSMRSRLSPGSPRSVSGSAPGSLFQHTPDSSQGSRSHGRSQGSGHSLVHQTSISSQGRRRRRRPEISESSLPSPYGRLSLGATGTSAMRFDLGQRDGGPSSPGTPFSAYFTVNGSVNSAGTNVTADVVDPVTGVAMRMPRMPAYTHDRENRDSHPYYPLGD